MLAALEARASTAEAGDLLADLGPSRALEGGWQGLDDSPASPWHRADRLGHPSRAALRCRSRGLADGVVAQAADGETTIWKAGLWVVISDFQSPKKRSDALRPRRVAEQGALPRREHAGCTQQG